MNPHVAHPPTVTSPGTSPGTGISRAITTSALVIARALDHRLQATLDDPFELPLARLYGCAIQDEDVRTGRPVVDLGLAVRFTFLGEAPDVYQLVEGPLGVVTRSFDAAAVATSGWGAPLDEDGVAAMRPSRHPDRFRVLLCTAIDDGGVASVMRDARRPDDPVDLDVRGLGALPDALEVMWCGAVTATVTPWRRDRPAR